MIKNIFKFFSKKVITFLLICNYTYSIPSPEKDDFVNLSYISLDYAIQSFSSIESIQVIESIFPQDAIYFSKLIELEHKEIDEIHPISKKINPKNPQYKEYINFLDHLIKEINKQKLTADWDTVNGLKHNQKDDYSTFCLNGQNNETYSLFDSFLQKKVDYESKWGWITDYTSTYNLQGKYCIAKNSRNSGNNSIDNHELIVTVTAINRLFSINKLPDIKFIFTFLKTYNVLKDKINYPTDEKFKLFDVVLEIPHLLKGTDLHRKIEQEFPSIYKLRNLIKTCLTLQFNYKTVLEV